MCVCVFMLFQPFTANWNSQYFIQESCILPHATRFLTYWQQTVFTILYRTGRPVYVIGAHRVFCEVGRECLEVAVRK
jgi:hypothetical protein